MKKANEILKRLCKVAEHMYEKEDACLSDFVTLQAIKTEIIDHHKANEIPDVAYKVLSNLCAGLIDDYKKEYV